MANSTCFGLKSIVDVSQVGRSSRSEDVLNCTIDN